MEVTFSTGFGLGILCGAMIALIGLDQLYRPTYKKMMDEVVAQYCHILNSFGITKNKKGNWEMTEKEKVWVKKV